MGNAILDKIKEGNRARRMRMGQNVADFVTLRSNPEVRFAMVPLLEVEYEQAWAAAAAIDQPDNPYGTEIRDRTLKVHSLWYALRMPEDIEQKVFDSPEELAEELEDGDINQLGDEYQSLVDYASPAIDGLDDDKVADLKKAWEQIDLNGLSGKSWWHLKMFFMTLTVDQLRANSLSRSSILNSTGMSDESLFTPGADQS